MTRLTFDEYRASPGLNISALKHLRHSPQMFIHRLENPDSSPAMQFGTLAHLLTLEPSRSDEVVPWTKRSETGAMSPRRGKDWEAFKAEHAGKLIVTLDEMNDAEDLARAVRSDPVAAKYLAKGEAEVSFSWQWPVGRCKARADWVTSVAGRLTLVGLKTARDCRPFQFGAAAARLGYHLQWAWYQDGWREAHGTDTAPRMVEIVVESEAPHSVIVYTIPDDVLEQGRGEYQDLLIQYQECQRSGDWHGPADVEQVLTLPSWVYGADDDLSDLGLEGIR